MGSCGYCSVVSQMAYPFYHIGAFTWQSANNSALPTSTIPSPTTTRKKGSRAKRTLIGKINPDTGEMIPLIRSISLTLQEAHESNVESLCPLSVENKKQISVLFPVEEKKYLERHIRHLEQVIKTNDNTVTLCLILLDAV